MSMEVGPHEERPMCSGHGDDSITKKKSIGARYRHLLQSSDCKNQLEIHIPVQLHRRATLRWIWGFPNLIDPLTVM